MMNDDKEAIKEALNHFVSRLSGLPDSDELNDLPPTIKSDIENTSKYAKKLIEKLPDMYSKIDVPDEERKIMCLALACYINDLK